MSDICIEIGKRIRYFRQNRKMTLQELSAAVYKSRATVSKYESGTISMDIDTLYALADALHVRVEQLLYSKEPMDAVPQREIRPAFFQGLNRFYSYHYDGRDHCVSKSVFDVFSQIGVNRYKIAMYMNYKDLEHYQRAENIYWGYIEHFDALSIIELTHQDTPTEKASIQILASFLDAETKWGLWNGVSSRPLMPVAVKFLFSKKPLAVDAELNRRLKISKEDIRRMKYYNMFSVV
ncbi:helix-turn-helix transcriptional regulator [uncultured Oscillibacter sp.]|uniref:helix-turn-helix domain-containing protein n=1 Tax=uncultured Oscillibacter sp. TaxID=876091 RepID=UPI0026150D3B|nr:helix-turn-helix transcriptional regulator [uncultured Oscillibacter sp.]